MKIRPLHDRVVIRRMEAETTSAGGIVIPDGSKDKPIRGEIIAVALVSLLTVKSRLWRLKPVIRCYLANMLALKSKLTAKS